jgi:ABC-type transport system substrate-binding protein
MKVITNPDAAASAFQACEVDFLPDMTRWPNVWKLTEENQTVIRSPGLHFCYVAFNCRDYVPNDAGQPDAGRPLAPLNWSGFRQALAWAGFSHAEKEEVITQLYGGSIVTAVDTPVPPSLGIWHREPPEYPGGNYTKAWEILQASGFSISEGKLIQPNGIQVRDQVEVLSPWSIYFTWAYYWVNKWNDFFDNYLGVTNCNFLESGVDFDEVLIPRAFTYRNFDMYFLCWSLTRYPDHLYDFFHSGQDYPDGNNTSGLDDPELDGLLETIKYSMDYEEKLQACYEAQDKLVFEDCPYVYCYSRTYFFAFKNYTYYAAEPKWFVGMVTQKGVGGNNPWTWGLMHWSNASTGGSARSVLERNPSSLHPGNASSYDWKVLNRVEDGLLCASPEMDDLPWVASSWSFEPFIYEPLNVNGSKVRFQLREDVKWHDLKPVTVEDVAFALNYSRGFPNLQPIWQYLLWTQIVDPYTIDVYTNTTSYWILYDLANLGTRFPKHIYNKPGSTTATLWNITYEQWTGQPPPPEYPFMKALIGCGPYVFDYWNATAGTVHLVKFQEYWVNSPVKSCVVLPQRVEPNAPFNYTIEIVNTGSADDITGEFVPAVIDNVAVRVNGQLGMVIPGPIVVQPFERVVLGPFTTSLEKGSQSIECDVMAYGETIDHYTCHCWSTIKEDVNLDIYVGIDDIFTVAGAFGSLPGEINWNECYDMNNDYYVGIDDIFQIATKFGWDP